MTTKKNTSKIKNNSNKIFTKTLQVSFLLRSIGLHNKEIAVEKHLERVNAFFAINNKRGIELSISTAGIQGLCNTLLKNTEINFQNIFLSLKHLD